MRRSYRSFADYAQHIRRIIDGYRDVIVDMELEVFEATPLEGLIRGKLVFIDGSHLNFLEYVRLVEGKPIKLRYRYHYSNAEGRPAFRYDNAPHHPEVETHPHHKHLSNGRVEAASEPTLKAVLEETIEHLR